MPALKTACNAGFALEHSSCLLPGGPPPANMSDIPPHIYKARFMRSSMTRIGKPTLQPAPTPTPLSTGGSTLICMPA